MAYPYSLNIIMEGRSAPLESQPNRWIAAILAKRSGVDPDAVQIADATIAVWYDISTALTSVIGVQGVVALYDRSVALAARTHVWLIPSRSHNDQSVDLDALHAVIARQTTASAADGSSQLLQELYNVLVSLIGPALCDQLLASVREDFASSNPKIFKNI